MRRVNFESAIRAARNGEEIYVAESVDLMRMELDDIDRMDNDGAIFFTDMRRRMDYSADVPSNAVDMAEILREFAIRESGDNYKHGCDIIDNLCRLAKSPAPIKVDPADEFDPDEGPAIMIEHPWEGCNDRDPMKHAFMVEDKPVESDYQPEKIPTRRRKRKEDFKNEDTANRDK